LSAKVGFVHVTAVYGEPTTALLAAQTMLHNGKSDQHLHVLSDLEDQLPEEASVLLLWALNQGNNQGGYTGSARVGSLVLGNLALEKYELAWSSVSPRRLVEDPEWREKIIDLSHEVRSWTPIKKIL
ncbi:MAG: hypothetical protein ABJ364_10480, partial [Lentilitoribacter sp.]